MAKKKKSPAPPIAPPPPEKPTFWFGFEVSWTKLLVARFVIFGLLAVDALLAIRHAPRYGAGGFNVAQIPGLDGLGPTRISYLVCELINAFLFTFAALGVGTRIVLPIATALYAWLYLGSQLDSYQHHYLVALILLLACFVPWERKGTDETVKSWAMRLILVQLGILYFYAAVSKFDPAWLDGRTLGGQIFTNPDALIDVRGLIDHTIGMKAMSHVIVVVELGLAAMVWNPRTWFIAAPLGILFHLGIVFTGLEIGLFAWLMIGFYLLVIPDRVFARIAAPLDRVLSRARGWLEKHPVAGIVGTIGGIAFAVLCRTDRALAVALAVFLVPYIIAVAMERTTMAGRIGLAQLVAFGLWFGVDRLTTVTGDYYKFWAGTSRRLGDLETSERAYRSMIETAPDDPSGHFQLGKILLARGDELDGMGELHDAEELEPTRARAWLEEARFLDAHQRHDAALVAARKAVEIEPKNADAKTLMSTLMGVTKANGAPAIPAKDDD